MKRTKFLSLLLIICLLFTGCGLIETKQSPAASVPVQGELQVHFIDVGQGDAILIQTASSAMLVDAGDNQYGPAVV